jgi:putative tryptophan/tyrosine transport system substrate-binding protein
MTTRREFITLLGGAAAAWPLAARAQQVGKLPRVGVLVSASPPHPFADAFRRGLRPLGYLEGKNIAVEFHYTGGRGDRAEDLADELVRVGVDVIVAHFTPAVRAAMGATPLAAHSWRTSGWPRGEPASGSSRFSSTAQTSSKAHT